MQKKKKSTLNILILAVYFIVILPIAMVYKALKLDPMRRSYKKNTHTYWDEKKNSAQNKQAVAVDGDGNKDPTNYPFW